MYWILSDVLNSVKLLFYLNKTQCSFSLLGDETFIHLQQIGVVKSMASTITDISGVMKYTWVTTSEKIVFVVTGMVGKLWKNSQKRPGGI